LCNMYLIFFFISDFSFTPIMNADKNTTTNRKEHALEQQPTVKKPRKKCHGNAKLQRFRRRCRAKGLNAKSITNLINKRSRIKAKPTTNNNAAVENMNIAVQVSRANFTLF